MQHILKLQQLTIPTLDHVISVSQLNRLARVAIEKSLPSCWISGEISNFTCANSGHWYFTLKDDQSSVKCAYFRNKNQFLDWKPTEGKHVEVRAQATLYEPRGDYQLLVEAMRQNGQGALYEEFIKLKLKLEREGLFREDSKLTLPHHPKCLGIITSLKTAALQDVLQTLVLRWPSCPIIIYPATVQGAEAAISIVQSLVTATARNECDILLIVRGGGSLEDLGAFNDERVARAIYASPIPIITGIGHETDFSIADFTADARAATPTAAAQRAVPDRNDQKKQILNLQIQINQIQNRRLSQYMQHLDGLTRRLIHPRNEVANAMKNIIQMKRRLQINASDKLIRDKQIFITALTRLNAYRLEPKVCKLEVDKQRNQLASTTIKRLVRQRTRLERCVTSLKQLNPNNVLSRGYCIAFNEKNEVIRNTYSLQIGSNVQVMTSEGKFCATVERKT